MGSGIIYSMWMSKDYSRYYLWMMITGAIYVLGEIN